MKKIKRLLVITASLPFWFSCKPQLKSSTEKLPTAINDIAAIQKIITGKTFTVLDAATILGSYESPFDKPKTNEIIVAPNVSKINWFSAKKSSKDTTDFIAKFEKETFEKFKKISLNFSNDSIAIATGIEAINHIYKITDSTEEKEQKGLKLKLTYNMEATSAKMGMSKFTATYYILGVNEKYLYLLTPNKLNDEKVFFLLEASK